MYIFSFLDYNAFINVYKVLLNPQMTSWIKCQEAVYQYEYLSLILLLSLDNGHDGLSYFVSCWEIKGMWSSIFIGGYELLMVWVSKWT